MNARTVIKGGLAVLCCLGLARPALAQGVGAIGGIARDESNAVLPGATVELTGQENHALSTDARG